MQGKVDKATYLSALRASLGEICFDLAGGERFDFEELFCPLRMDEGMHALQSYGGRMDWAHHSEEDDLDEQLLEEYPILKERLQARQQLLLQEGIPRQPEDWLIYNSGFPTGNLLDPRHPYVSHVLAMAGAGHGKSTLLRRIALYYCHPEDETPAQQAVRQAYGLIKSYVPCMLRLRDLADGPICVDAAIQDSLLAVLRGWAGWQGESDPTADNISDLLGWPRNMLLLLVDGLDELPRPRQLELLQALDAYLKEHPAQVIMTSRAAGLSDPEVRKALGKMRFVGRSILPLTDEEALAYAKKWIEITQPREKHAALWDAVDQIQRQSRFQYLRPFLRTPLELVSMLRQLSAGALSPNRYQMFYDLLREVCTRHIRDYRQKQPRFSDTLALLGVLAYHMQINDTLFISRQELGELSPILSRMSYYTDQLGDGSPQALAARLDELAADTDIIGRDDRAAQEGYTFPIRAYQEFLTAYACCHLRLDEEWDKPEPLALLQGHLRNGRWDGVVQFALSDLNQNDEDSFDGLFTAVMKQVDDIDSLLTIAEADLSLTQHQALLFCRQAFAPRVLSPLRQQLLDTCMHTQSAPAYVRALHQAYQEEGDGAYLSATATAAVMWAVNTGRSPQAQAVIHLEKGTAAQARLGAMMIDQLAMAWLDEGPEECRAAAAADLTIDEPLLRNLHANARAYQDAWSVKALTDLWLTRAPHSQWVAPLLTVELAQIVRAAIETWRPVSYWHTSEWGALRHENVRAMQQLLETLGAFPPWGENQTLMSHGHSSENLFIAVVHQRLYSLSCNQNEFQINQTALAVAGLYCRWNRRVFTRIWGGHVCGGQSTQEVDKLDRPLREQNLFALVRDAFQPFQQEYLTQPELDIPFHYLWQPWRARRFCEYGRETVQLDFNVEQAFILRYGRPDTPQATAAWLAEIYELLTERVDRGDPYAAVNLILCHLSQGEYEQAQALMARLEPQDWQAAAENFWLPALWEAVREPEGALVAVLAIHHGGCHFERYNEMLQEVRQHCPQLPDDVLWPQEK